MHVDGALRSAHASREPCVGSEHSWWSPSLEGESSASSPLLLGSEKCWAVVGLQESPPVGPTVRRRLPSTQPAPHEGWHTPSPTPARSGRGSWTDLSAAEGRLRGGTRMPRPRVALCPARMLQDLRCPLEAIRQEGSGGGWPGGTWVTSPAGDSVGKGVVVHARAAHTGPARPFHPWELQRVQPRGSYLEMAGAWPEWGLDRNRQPGGPWRGPRLGTSALGPARVSPGPLFPQVSGVRAGDSGGGSWPPLVCGSPSCPTPRDAPGPGRGVWSLDLGCEGPQLQKRSEKATTSPSAPPPWKGAILAGSRADVTDGDSWWAGAAEVSGAVAVLIAPWVTRDAAQGDEQSRRRAARPGSLSSEQPLVFSS